MKLRVLVLVLFLFALIQINGVCQNSNLDSMLNNAQIKDSVYLTDTTIEIGNRFYQKQFLNDFELFGIKINGLANFVQCGFEKDATFLEIEFQNMCAVIAANFYKQAIFRANTYVENASFRLSTFYGYSEFRNSIFYKGADFFCATFKNEADFSGSTILDTLNFSFVKIEGSRIIDLTKCSSDTNKFTNRTININLTNADIDKIRIDYLKFRLYFDKDVNFEDRSNVYLSLLNNFKRDGYSDSYEILDKEYQHFRNTYKSNLRNHLYDFLQRLWWNYGYNKEYIFYWTIFFLVLFTFLNYRLADTLNRHVYTIENLKYTTIVSAKKMKGSKLIFYRLYFSLLYTCIVFFAFNVKFDKLHFGKKALLVYFLLIYSIGIVCLAYLANYVLKS